MKGMRLPLVKDKYGTIVDQNGETPVVSGFSLSCGRSSPMVEARTDFIVRAVNSHDALVEALEEAMSWNWLEDTPPPKEIIERLEQTLVVAKGEDNV